jgi:hypothetical protein
MSVIGTLKILCVAVVTAVLAGLVPPQGPRRARP